MPWNNHKVIKKQRTYYKKNTVVCRGVVALSHRRLVFWESHRAASIFYSACGWKHLNSAVAAIFKVLGLGWWSLANTDTCSLWTLCQSPPPPPRPEMESEYYCFYSVTGSSEPNLCFVLRIHDVLSCTVVDPHWLNADPDPVLNPGRWPKIEKKFTAEKNWIFVWQKIAI